MEWIFAHMEDADLNDPIEKSGGNSKSSVDETSLMMLMSMGFAKKHSEQALRATDGDLERAAVWVMSHPEEEAEEDAGDAGAGGSSFDSDCSQYELIGFASHMGSSVHCGHYVAHVKKEGKWIIFNDRKVAESEATPIDRGYMYLFRRSDFTL